MLVFVDESGDTGIKFKYGSSELMTIVLVIFEMEEASQVVAEKISQLRQDLRLAENFEFHFKVNSDKFREAFLKAVAPCEFFYTGIIIDKPRLYTPDYDPKRFYKNVCGMVFEEAKGYLLEAKVRVDRSGGVGFQKEFAAFLKRQINDPTTIEKRIKQVTMHDSKSDSLLQLADMICGAVNRSYRADHKDADRFRKIIAHREKAVRLWPE